MKHTLISTFNSLQTYILDEQWVVLNWMDKWWLLYTENKELHTVRLCFPIHITNFTQFWIYALCIKKFYVSVFFYFIYVSSVFSIGIVAIDVLWESAMHSCMSQIQFFCFDLFFLLLFCMNEKLIKMNDMRAQLKHLTYFIFFLFSDAFESRQFNVLAAKLGLNCYIRWK